MNPSATGWVTKLGQILVEQADRYESYDPLYEELKKTGFVYGVHIAPLPFIASSHPLTEDETAKVNLLAALYFCFTLAEDSTSLDEFISSLFDFYLEMGIANLKQTQKILDGHKDGVQLEKLLDSRIYLGGNVFNKSFGNNLTNALLYIDVLIYMGYLRGEVSVQVHAQLLEYVSINLAYHALYSKDVGNHDLKLIKMLSSSLSFIQLDIIELDVSYKELIRENFSEWELEYLFDMACLTVWEDKTLEKQESAFIHGIGGELLKSEKEISRRLQEVNTFFEENYAKVPYLKSKNLASNFFEGVTKNVRRLLKRNSKRLKKELLESRELIDLLRQSTQRELTVEEKKKVQEQLLDIFKTIPSFAIFILPGGAVLLPIAISLIPKLLPSAFDENRLDDPPLEKSDSEA